MPDLRAIVFDIGNTLVHAAPVGTAVHGLTGQPIGNAIADLRALSLRYRLAAVTDTALMTGSDVRDALDRSGFQGLLDPIITSVDIGAPKPDPRGLLTALEQMHVAPGQALFIGDADVDRLAAAASGVAFEFAVHDIQIVDIVSTFLRSNECVADT